MITTVAPTQVKLHKYGISGLKKSQNTSKQFPNRAVASKAITFATMVEADR